MNQQISCQAGSDATNRRACAAASCPISLYGVGQRGCAAAGWHPASGLGRRRQRRPRPAAARPAAWRHVASRAPQPRTAAARLIPGRPACRPPAHTPTCRGRSRPARCRRRSADHAGAGSVGSPRARQAVASFSAGGCRHKARPARPVTGLATRAAHRLVRACRRRAVPTGVAGATKTAGPTPVGQGHRGMSARNA